MLKKIILSLLLLTGCAELTDKDWESLKSIHSKLLELSDNNRNESFVNTEQLPEFSHTLSSPTPTAVIDIEPEIVGNKKEKEFSDKLTNNKCTEWLNPNDGYKNGFILLESSTLKIVKAVLPADFQEQFNSCELRFETKLIDKMFFSGFANPDFTGKKRQHWNGKISIKKLPDNSVLKCDNICWRLKKITTRID